MNWSIELSYLAEQGEEKEKGKKESEIKSEKVLASSSSRHIPPPPPLNWRKYLGQPASQPASLV